MARTKVSLPEEDLAPLRTQLFAWRSKRTGREAIPAEVWAGAAALARVHGVCPVARALGLDYAALKRRLTHSDGQRGLAKPAFLEFRAAQAVPSAPGASIEISAPNGARMSIQLGAGQGQDAAGIVAAFLAGHR